MKDAALKNYISAITDTVKRCYRECEGSCPLCENDKCQCEKAKNLERLKELAEYRRLDEEGLLLRLPCKVGDIVYVKMASHCNLPYAKAEVRDFTHYLSCGFCIVVTSKHFDKQSIPFTEINKTVFLTKEEAERALESMGGVNG